MTSTMEASPQQWKETVAVVLLDSIARHGCLKEKLVPLKSKYVNTEHQSDIVFVGRLRNGIVFHNGPTY